MAALSTVGGSWRHTAGLALIVIGGIVELVAALPRAPRKDVLHAVGAFGAVVGAVLLATTVKGSTAERVTLFAALALTAFLFAVAVWTIATGITHRRRLHRLRNEP
jgi:hypothetical protein